MDTILGTKGETLFNLREKVKQSSILDLYIVKSASWNKNRSSEIKNIEVAFPNESNFVVRSSALSEDCHNQSNAGAFNSFLSVPKKEIASRVDDVFKSYEEVIPEDQVLIQPMLETVKASGVIFTCNQDTKAPYYIINYDDQSARTDTITSGSSKEHKTRYIYKSHRLNENDEFYNLLNSVKELESICSNDKLDIEFAIDEKLNVYILQVRPLVFHEDKNETLDILPQLKTIQEKFNSSNMSHPYLCGESTVYGVMPDWNPAEIIGVRPRRLAMSLYKELITDNVWAYQRDNYGYRNLRSFPLLVNFGGIPYIDVRISMNSFIPDSVPFELANKLANHYIERLKRKPELHDKIEFEIVFSCFTLDTPKKLKVLKEYGFTEEEIKTLENSLRDLTNNVVNNKTGLWLKDTNKIEVLDKRRDEVLSSSMPTLNKIYWLVEDCKRYGTLPFAGLARAAFIAVQILKSMVDLNLLSQKEYDTFLRSLSTVSKELHEDYHNLTFTDFIQKYGHLRPGTYDILSPNYAENPELYFNKEDIDQAESLAKAKEFKLSLEQLSKIDEVLNESGLDLKVLDLFEFIRKAIEGREFAKFVFTKNVNSILNLLHQEGKKLGFSLEELSHLDIACVIRLYSEALDIREVISESIKSGQKQYEIAQKISLPPLIVNEEDIFSFYISSSQPTFVTQKKIVAPSIFINSPNDDLKGKIVLIESADPGFDWIFSRGIAGLITLYGGANSHMAIRASELGIPAVIGAGEKSFQQWRKGKTLEIDAASKLVRVIK